MADPAPVLFDADDAANNPTLAELSSDQVELLETVVQDMLFNSNDSQGYLNREMFESDVPPLVTQAAMSLAAFLVTNDNGSFWLVSDTIGDRAQSWKAPASESWPVMVLTMLRKYVVTPPPVVVAD